MVIVGFHGTTRKKAQRIIRDGEFEVSTGNKHWLGTGIYFYTELDEALAWKGSNGRQNTDTVLMAIINVPDKYVMDIDDSSQRTKVSEFLKILEDSFDHREGTLKINGTTQENQCALANMLWDDNPRLNVLIGRFRKGLRKAMTLTDVRPLRKEFCLRNGRYIRHIHVIKKEDVYD